jgi:hypothetical protein
LGQHSGSKRGESIGQTSIKAEEGTMDFHAHETARIRAQGAPLTRHYRAIGPAAILAALLFRKPLHSGVRSR